ncbi:unnamed protein product [Brassicogethes aeneus]|uniref:Transcription initiation factor TFIID subunit 8 n=1 Tax=Brassicogethes aeneus TaxID=1431903 RepID=A0A9P0AWH9_BRAAE|nr:unnamed protein product [Brassicogethes aeneus]
MVNFNFKGLMAPVFTVFNDDMTLNTNKILNYATFLQKSGINGVLGEFKKYSTGPGQKNFNGTSGEGMSLNVKERMSVAESWVKAVKETKQHLMVQVGGAPLPDVLQLAKHAEQIGVDSILCLPELYFKPTNVEELANYLKLVGEAAPNTPLLYYHIPAWTNVNIHMGKFLNFVPNKIPTFSGIKFTSVNLEEGMEAVRANNRSFAVFLGADTLTAGAMAMGFDSAISTTLNIFPQLSIDIMNFLKSSKIQEAKETQDKLSTLTSIITKNGTWVPTMKAAMNLATPINVGVARSPLMNLNKDQLTEMKNSLSKHIKFPVFITTKSQSLSCLTLGNPAVYSVNDGYVRLCLQFLTKIINMEQVNVYRKMLAVTVTSVLLEHGFDGAEKDSLGTLTEMLQAFICEVGHLGRNYCELNGRSEPLLADIIMAFVDMGYNLNEIPKYVRGVQHSVLPSLQPQTATKQLNMLSAGTKQSLPVHIPQHYPPFPDPHAYVRTPTHKQPVIDYESVREKAAIQKRDIEKALTKFLAKTSEVHNLFETDEANIFPLIACKPPYPPYLSALLPQDQIFDPEDLDFDPKSQILQQVKDAKEAKERKRVKIEPKEEVEEAEENLNDSAKSEESTTPKTFIDNPYLAATKLPSKENAEGS